MDWQDEAIVLSARKHGEHAIIVQLLTRDHGRHAGLVRGGAGSRARGIYQPGNRVQAEWRARLAEHLGTYRCELVEALAVTVLDDPDRLAALSAACAIVESAVPEREPYASIYNDLRYFFDNIDDIDWAAAYVRWELSLLTDLGYGLDLSKCAATGAVDDLIYVSPKSGRAVSRAAGDSYQRRLLPLPAFLRHRSSASAPDILAGLRLTGYFLETHLFAHLDTKLPPARERLIDRLERAATISRSKDGS